MKKLISLSVVFPAYNDEKTIGPLVEKVSLLATKLARDWEVIVVNDASTDGTAEMLARLTKKFPRLHAITHRYNRGYGGALTRGFSYATKAFVFYTDGDGQYDVTELKHLTEKMDNDTDMVTGYKLKRSDPWLRKIVGGVYNQFVKAVFELPVRDVDCDFRLFRRSLLTGVRFTVTSGAFDVEFLSKLTRKKARITEIPVHHYPRAYGRSQFFSMRRILESLWEVGRLWILHVNGRL